jgi:hypothetical protein
MLLEEKKTTKFLDKEKTDTVSRPTVSLFGWLVVDGWC